MGLFSRSTQTTRTYPATGTTLNGNQTRFRRHKTHSTRQAAQQGQAWEDRDRQQDQRGRWYRPAR